MLKITAIGNLTNDVTLKTNETTGKPYAILRIASDRRYKDKDGNKLTDFISVIFSNGDISPQNTFKTGINAP